MTDAMEAEFDTVAEWTAQIAAELGPDYYLPAGCRGSGSPAALDWLIERMDMAPGATLLDSGAGVGGPAAYAARSGAVRPVLVEPETGACRAARKLFGFPVACAMGSALPMRDSTFDAAWSLGVLCTTRDQLALLTELRRVVRPGGSVGLLVFVAHRDLPSNTVDGNHFPTSDELEALLASASLHVDQRLGTADLPPIDDSWNERVETVENALSDRYGHTEAWELAERQSSRIGDLLEDGSLTGELFVLRHV